MTQPRFVIGDSLSALPGQTLPAWPVVRWDDDVINLAISGTRAFNWAADTTWAKIVQPGDEWWVMLGTNDAAGKVLGVWGYDYEANMREIVGLLVDRGATVHIMQSPPWARDWASDAQIHAVNVLLDWQRTVDWTICDESPQVECGPDLFDLFTAGDEHFAEDGVHFSDIGIADTAAAISLPEPSMPVLGVVALIVVAVVASWFGRSKRRPAARWR